MVYIFSGRKVASYLIMLESYQTLFMCKLQMHTNTLTHKWHPQSQFQNRYKRLKLVIKKVNSWEIYWKYFKYFSKIPKMII